MLVRSLVLPLMLLPSAALAYPIPPQTLWSLVEGADLIVLAETRSIEALPRTGKPRSPTVAVLEVLETWRGPSLEVVRVPYPAGLLCPAPPRYVVGELVLAFLAEEEGEWRTVALSYGTLYPHFDELEIWRERVASAIALRANGEVTGAQRQRWLVETAARAATRWHGVYELNPAADRLHSYYDRTRPKVGVLTAEEVEILARGLTKEPVIDTNLVAILDLLRGHPSREVDALAVAASDLLAGLEEPPYFFDALVQLTLERLGKVERPPEPAPAGELDDPLLVGVPHQAPWAKQAWAAVRATIQIGTSSVALGGPRSPRVRGTGGETPP